MWERFRKLDRSSLEKKFDTAVKVISSIADVAVHLKKPSYLGAALVASRAYRTYKEVFVPFENWQRISTNMNIGCVLEDLKKQESPTFDTRGGFLITIEDVDFYMRQDKKDTQSFGGFEISVSPEQCEKPCLEILNRTWWKHYQDFIEMRPSFNYEGKISFQMDSLRDTTCYESEIALEILEHLKKMDFSNYCRIVLVHGKPGTGKSEILKYVAMNLGMTTLKYRGDQFQSVYERLRSLDPEVVILDDLDHGNLALAIDQIDCLRSTCKVLLISANDIEKFDPALLRSGRFDDIYEIQKLDDSVIGKLLEDVPEDLKKDLEILPIAYISEFKKQVVEFGETNLENLAKSLIQRAKMVDSLSEAQKTKVLK